MRTALFIAAGLALLALALLVTPAYRRQVATLGFMAAWFVVSAVNFGVGVSRGYGVGEELLIHLFLFGVPALAAWLAPRWLPPAR